MGRGHRKQQQIVAEKSKETEMNQIVLEKQSEPIMEDPDEILTIQQSG
jgi:hypothetical protein